MPGFRDAADSIEENAKKQRMEPITAQKTTHSPKPTAWGAEPQRQIPPSKPEIFIRVTGTRSSNADRMVSVQCRCLFDLGGVFWAWLTQPSLRPRRTKSLSARVRCRIGRPRASCGVRRPSPAVLKTVHALALPRHRASLVAPVPNDRTRQGAHDTCASVARRKASGSLQVRQGGRKALSHDVPRSQCP
jgi:hypothetical protein